jgi:hypothetical protein
MNRKLMLGIIIVLVILILIIVALLIAGPKDNQTGTNNTTNDSDLSTDLENLDSGDEVIDQDINSEIVNLEE